MKGETEWWPYRYNGVTAVVQGARGDRRLNGYDGICQRLNNLEAENERLRAGLREVLRHVYEEPSTEESITDIARAALDASAEKA